MYFLFDNLNINPVRSIAMRKRPRSNKIDPTVIFTFVVDVETRDALNAEFALYEPSPAEKSAMRKIDLEDVKRNDERLETTPMRTILLEKIAEVHQSRNVEKSLRDLLVQDYPKKAEIIELLDESYKPQMKPSWIPSGLRGWRQSPLYRQRRAQCNDAMAALIASGKAIAFSLATLSKAKHAALAKQFHLQPLMNVPSRKKEGRTCLNCSASSGPSGISINEGSDNIANDAKRPMYANPSVVDVSDLAIHTRRKYPGQRLVGKKIDVRAAFTQFTVEASAHELQPLRFSTVVEQEDEKGQLHKIVVAHICGVFGFTRSGMAYSTLQEFFDWQHNHDRDRESWTYVDDGMLIQPLARMDESAKRYMKGPFGTLGTQSIENDRVESFDDGLEAIGWEWNFLSWTVKPRPASRRKLLWRWWVRLPTNENEGCEPRCLESAMGALIYYAQIVPLVHAFLPSVNYALNSAKRLNQARVFITDHEAVDDYRWLRAIVWVLAFKPELIEKNIDRVGTVGRPNFIIESDASTGVGAGGVLSRVVHSDAKEEVDVFVLRWHEQIERDHIRTIAGDIDKIIAEDGESDTDGIRRVRASINVLEFYAVMYIVMKHAKLLQGSIVHTLCDNTSAVRWINKLKGSNRSRTSRALLRVLAVVCQFYDITILSFHISGISNIRPDFISRNIHLQDDVPMPTCPNWILDDSAVEEWANQKPERIARVTLGRALNKPSSLHGKALLKLPIDLLG